jgi:TolB-like protein/Tfp pilus assembly protein PilF
MREYVSIACRTLSTSPPRSEADLLLSRIDEVELEKFVIVGEYVRFDHTVRNSLKDFKLRLISILESQGTERHSFLVWGPPGSGKTYLVQQIAKCITSEIDYREFNLAQADELEFRSELEAMESSPKPCLCFIDEVDSRPSESWPYEALIPYMEPSRETGHSICFVLAGSGGSSLDDMKGKIASRPKGKDLLSRVLRGNEFTVPPLGVGDKLLVAVAQMVASAREKGLQIREIEKLALYYIATNPAFSSARQLRGLSVACANRIPRGEDRVKYDHLFSPGDMENKEFWLGVQSKNRTFSGSFLSIGTSTQIVPPATTGIAPRVLDRHRVAVLPLQNISPDPKDEYFADGMTEELISTMSKISGLSVIARTSVMRYKSGGKSIGEVARELMVGTILEGSVRKAGEKLRITVQLIDSSNEEHLWAQNYDRKLEDVFAIQTEVAQNVADSLKMQLLDKEKEKIEKKPTENIVAYTSYLKGRYYWNKRNRESLEKAIKNFEEAIKRDPNFALAYSGLSDCYSVLIDQGHLSLSEGLVRTKETAMKALELDNSLAEAHTSLAGLLDNEWDWARAEEEFVKALKANPNYATAHHWYSIHLLYLGRLDEAIKELKTAEELDPLSPQIRAHGAWVYLDARQFNTALTKCDEALELDPNFVPGYANRSWVYLAKSMFNEAVADLERVLPFFQQPSARRAIIGAIYAIAGRTEEAKKILRECEETAKHERAEDMNYGALALIHLKLGNKDRAFESLEKAFKTRTITPFLCKLSPFYDELTSDPKFDELMKKSGAYERLPRHS